MWERTAVSERRGKSNVEPVTLLGDAANSDFRMAAILGDLRAAAPGLDIDGIAITGDGDYCFALESSSRDGVTYRSREATVGGPVIVTSM